MPFPFVANFSRAVLKKVLSRYRIGEDVLDFFTGTSKVGQPSEVAVPKELLPMGALLYSRGMFTQWVVQTNLDWTWPYWIERQFRPETPDFMARGHHLFSLNCTHRNWTGVGPLGSREEGVVDGRGLLMPWRDGWSLDVWVKIGDKLFCPSQLPFVRQSLVENLPMVKTEFQADELLVSTEVFGANLSGRDVLLQNISVKNKASQNVSGSLIFSIRPYNAEGVGLIKSLSFKNEHFFVNGSYAGFFLSLPDQIFVSDFSRGDVKFFVNGSDGESDGKTGIVCPAGLCTGAFVYSMNIPPGKEKSETVVLSLKPSRRTALPAFNGVDFHKEKQDTLKLWKTQLAKTLEIQIPDEKMQTCFDANKSYLLLLYDGDQITPGVFTYHHFWFRDAAYMVNALDKAGLFKEAENILKTYPSRQRKDGFFISQDGEWDANGQAIWAMVEHFKLTGGRAYLESVYPSIIKGVRWINKKREKTKNDAGPHRGLLPAGFSAEHLGPNDYFYWDDFWCLGGIWSALEAARALGKTEDEKFFKDSYDDFLGCVEISLQEVSKRLGRKAIPASPYRRLDPGLIGSVACVYPVRLFTPDDERVQDTLSALRECSFMEDAFFQNIVHTGFNCYLTLQAAQVYILNRSPEALPLITWVLNHATPTFTWPEAIHPKTRGGSMGDGHHGWAVAEWVHAVRNMLFFEEEDRLVLTPCIPHEWTHKGKRIIVKNAPTYFGGLNFTISFEEDAAVLSLETDFKRTPEKIEWNLPVACDKMEVDGVMQELKGEKRMYIEGTAKEIRVWFK